MESSSVPDQTAGDKGLKKNAIGFLDGLTIGLNSTAPAYSLAAVIGSIVVAVGVKAPAVLLVSFIPMFFIAGAFYYMNRADQDCGTTFSWVTRAMGPWFGFIGGWAICVTGVLVVGSLADVAARYTFVLLGMDSLAESRAAVIIFAVAIVVRHDRDLRDRHGALGARAAVPDPGPGGRAGALRGRRAGEGHRRRRRRSCPTLDWFWPGGVEYSAMLSGVLLAVFIYWGWESAVNLTEESEDSATAPGSGRRRSAR